jgi:hypothetical protein
MVEKRRRAAIGEARAFLDDIVARRSEIHGCVFWPFSRDVKGYAKINVSGKPNNAHRVVCAEVNGPPPTSKHQAAHSCGNGKLGCVGPNCLRWATQVENEADKVAHGTRLTGSDVGNSKLTIDDVRKIHVLRAQGMTQEEIAATMNVRRQQVGRVADGSRWASAHPDNDNVTAEMVAKTSTGRPSADCRVTMPDESVRQMHVMKANGMAIVDISQEMKIDYRFAHRILTGERRRHLHPANDAKTADMVLAAKQDIAA